MELYVIRHGQTIVNVKELINARNMIGINKKGKEEAEKASEQIKKTKIDLIFCSPLRRTRQTCKIINKNKVKVIYDKRILERHSRSMQFEKIEKLDFEEWYNTDKTKVYKNSEGFQSILDRVKKFFEELKREYPNKSILIVTHGDVCKAVYAYLNNVTDAKEISLFNQGNCEIKKYEIN